MNKRFLRRTYSHPREFLLDFRYMMSHRAMIRRAMRELIPPSFRERLMMTVTEVNGCRYCSYYHSRRALTSGVPETELREMLAGSIPQDTPAAELPALLYARQWAESNASPDLQAEKHLREVYGEERTQAIEIILHMIRAGNLMGNTADYWLAVLTFGRFGLREDEARFAISKENRP
jgi:AhpD family alkylhydroperoxidase